MKMFVGFGSILLLVIIAVLIILFNVNTIRNDASALNDEFVPEIRIANDVERNSLMTMYAMRGYSQTFQESFWKDASTNLEQVFASLGDAEALAARAIHLTKLSAGVATAKEHAGEYEALAKETNSVIAGIETQRGVLDAAAAEYMASCHDFLAGQNTRMENEIAAGVSSAALAQRHSKITLMNQIISTGNDTRIKNFRGQLETDPALMNQGIANFDAIDKYLAEIRTITFQAADIEELNHIQDAGDTYKRGMQSIRDSYLKLQELNGKRNTAADQVLEASRNVAMAGLDATEERTGDSLALVQATFITLVIGIIAVLVVSTLIALLLTRMITTALSKGVLFAGQIARGDLDATLDVYQRDEIGQLADALREMLKSLQYKAEMIGRFAAGDFSQKVQLASSEDGLGKSLETMRSSLNDLLGQVNIAIDQVTSGADQVSQASQSLSQGATEQASSLEEISSSINEVNGQSQQNAKNSLEANALAKQATENAENGNSQMQGLVVAMGEINSASDEIKKIVKIIDDIAFQINLLALNANVEAARAGKYGRGFAVVAEEVRNLAARSAEAVKDTTARVDESVRSIETGNKAAEATAIQLEDIVSGVGKVATFLEEIAQASREQAQAVSQITEGLDQIDQVTQANTASAEESASASEELASQAQHLQQMISQFTLEVRSVRQIAAPQPASSASHRKPVAPAPSRSAAPVKKQPKSDYEFYPDQEETGITPVDPEEVIKLDDDDFDRF